MTKSEIEIAAERIKLENTISETQRKIQVEKWALEVANASLRLLEKDPNRYFEIEKKIKECYEDISR